MRIHLIGVAGTGMGQLAALFRAAGHEVSGSDTSFDPPMGPALEAAGVACLRGFDPAHLEPLPDLVVVGNVARRDNPEAVRAAELGLARTSMSEALREHFLAGRRAVVVTGTHGKTTTSAMAAHLLREAQLDPGWFIGGLPQNLPSGSHAGKKERKLGLLGSAPSGDPAARRPFVVEGDEYDAVCWKKEPKFFDYVGVSDGDVVVITSIEHDHVDIYPTAEAYDAQFAELIRRVPEGGLLVASAHEPRIRALVAAHARCRVSYYALEGDDTGEVTPTWLAAPVAPDGTGIQPFDLYASGSFVGRLALQVPGAHNVRNATAAFAAAAEGCAAEVGLLRTATGTFRGVKRRQERLGAPAGVTVYDDFAHHPTAVDETLRALRSQHPRGRLFAVFEPRSATACRAVHQDAYARAFDAADRVVLAPLGRTTIPEAERLDRASLCRALGERATAPDDVDAILALVCDEARSGDVVALLSNGAFGGIHARLLEALGQPR